MIKLLTKPITYLRSADFRLRFKIWRWDVMQSLPMGKYILRKLYNTSSPRLGQDVFGIHFRSPIGVAAGIDRNGEIIDALSAAGFGFVEVGSITPRPQGGSPHPYLFRLGNDRAVLYRSQIESQGIEQVIENIKQHHSKIVVGCNIAKNALTEPEDAPREYLRLFRPLYQYVDYFTVNICLNTTASTYIPTDRSEIMNILTPLFEFRRGQNQYRPILLKISPDMSDEQIDMMTDIMLDTPLDGIVAVAGTTGRYGLDNSTAQIHRLGRTAGIIGGRPLKNRAIEVVKRIHTRSKGTYPIIGCGGVSTPEDVEDMLKAGATLVQICTEFIYDGGKAISRLNRALDNSLAAAEQTQESVSTAEQKGAASQTTNNE